MFLAIWLTTLAVLVVGLSLILHSLSRRVSAAFRFVFYLPAALAGAGSVMLWLSCSSPGVSPWSFILTWRFPLSVGIALELFNPQTTGFYTGQLQLHTAAPPSEIALLLLVTCAPVLIVLAVAQRWVGSGQVQDVFR